MNQTAAFQPEAAWPVSVEDLGDRADCYTLGKGRPPLFIERRDDVLADRSEFQRWSERLRPVLDDLIVAHGGIVLRGFPFEETADFRRFTELFPAFSGGYAGGVAPRSQISGGVMEATRLAPAVRLALHSEMAYMRDYPKRVAFYSHRTAPVGGETIIGDMRSLVDELPGDLVARIGELGVTTTRNYGPKSEAMDGVVEVMDSIGWNIAFGTDSREEVEALCADRGLETLWNENGSLTLFNRTEPFVVHPKTGNRLYRSVLHAFIADKRPDGADNAAYDAVRRTQKYPSGTALGDGQVLTSEEIGAFEAVIDKFTYFWPWQDGDVMLLDNLQVWHGRNPYEGARDVQVALLD